MLFRSTGPGIPVAERTLVLQPFYRALGTNVDGSGLGLAIVQEIVQQHGAELRIDDARPRSLATAQGMVLYDRAIALKADEVHLGCGARLACDVPLLAIEGQVPVWQSQCALALTPEGQIATDHYQRSTSHPQVFAVNDGSMALARNLPAATTGGHLHASRNEAGALHLLFGGTQ